MDGEAGEECDCGNPNVTPALGGANGFTHHSLQGQGKETSAAAQRRRSVCSQRWPRPPRRRAAAGLGTAGPGCDKLRINLETQK